MLLPANAFVAVVDGENLNLFKNAGDETTPALIAMEVPSIGRDNKGSGARHSSSAANPDESQQSEDGFAAGVAAMLNGQVLAGHIDALIVVAAPRTLGELRKHYHKALSAKLVGELAKDLTGHPVHDVEKAIANA